MVYTTFPKEYFKYTIKPQKSQVKNKLILLLTYE